MRARLAWPAIARTILERQMRRTATRRLQEVSEGLITVTLPDGRKTTADIEESMLSPEILARVLLLQMHRANSSRTQPAKICLRNKTRLRWSRGSDKWNCRSLSWGYCTGAGETTPLSANKNFSCCPHIRDAATDCG